ncbi:MAG: hypothetical protein AAFN93_22050 [Bacteroidota bacterium]
MRSSEYKIIKSSWGIWISITAEIGSVQHDQLEVTDLIGIKLAPDCINLSPQEIDYLKAGIKWVEHLITPKIAAPITIKILEIRLVLTDYQAEGLYYAIASWLAEQFGFNLPSYRYSYNKEKNRYEFPDMIN